MRNFRRIFSFLSREDWIVIGWVSFIKILLFFAGAKSYPMLWDKALSTPHQWLGIWDQWDFGYYQKIAEFGYGGFDGSIEFYPLFPWVLGGRES